VVLDRVCPELPAVRETAARRPGRVGRKLDGLIGGSKCPALDRSAARDQPYESPRRPPSRDQDFTEEPDQLVGSRPAVSTQQGPHPTGLLVILHLRNVPATGAEIAKTV